MSMQENQDHGDEVFVFMERITPIEGREDDVLSITRKSAKLLQGQPGMIQSMVTQSEKKGGELCSVTVWQKKADFQSFMKTDAVAALLESEDFKNIKNWMSEYDMQMMNLVDGWHG
ncbi:MAG: hypothetical protein GXP55_09110 [Deltaproteobacteria bacterium]|nr:hypothetical protein [Deltaproteobacteria bacterium]